MVVFQLLANGIIYGSLLALVALGLALIFGVMGIKNFAHGDLVTIGAYATWMLAVSLGFNPLLSLPIVMALGFVLGWILQRLVIARVMTRPLLEGLIVTYGLGITLMGSLNWLFTGNYQNYSHGPTGNFTIGTVVLGLRAFSAFVVSIALVLLVLWFLYKTKTGFAMRAAAQHRDAAAACGVDLARIDALAFAVGTAMAVAAGAMISMSHAIHPSMGHIWLLDAFVVVVISGLGNVAGALGGAFAIGIVRSVLSYSLDNTWAQIITYSLMYVVLLWRPQGLFAEEETT